LCLYFIGTDRSQPASFQANQAFLAEVYHYGGKVNVSDPAIATPLQRPHTEMLPFSNEDIPMTFQIGMVGSDGILIASDQKAGRWERYKTTSHVTKVFCDAELGAIYCGSGSDVAVRAGKRTIEIALSEPNLPMSKCAEKAATEVWIQRYENPEFTGQPQEESVVIARVTDSNSDLWYVKVGNPSLCKPILDRVNIGDVSNASIFFSERYFPGMSEKRPPIARLLPLAAHIVLMAGKLNPTGVDGLEIAICRVGECRKLEENELAPLRDFSNRIDDLFRLELFNAPNVIGEP
jgi:hypothetical protein